ncbi:MAG: hypothetical protein ABIE74_10305 [Pseudomonadota bacterium]
MKRLKLLLVLISIIFISGVKIPLLYSASQSGVKLLKQDIFLDKIADDGSLLTERGTLRVDMILESKKIVNVDAKLLDEAKREIVFDEPFKCSSHQLVAGKTLFVSCSTLVPVHLYEDQIKDDVGHLGLKFSSSAGVSGGEFSLPASNSSEIIQIADNINCPQCPEILYMADGQMITAELKDKPKPNFIILSDYIDTSKPKTDTPAGADKTKKLVDDGAGACSLIDGDGFHLNAVSEIIIVLVVLLGVIFGVRQKKKRT